MPDVADFGRLLVGQQAQYGDKKKAGNPFGLPAWWLSYQDSNLERQNQNLLCYHYTIAQSSLESECKGNAKFLK